MNYMKQFPALGTSLSVDRDDKLEDGKNIAAKKPMSSFVNCKLNAGWFFKSSVNICCTSQTPGAILVFVHKNSYSFMVEMCSQENLLSKIDKHNSILD